MVHFLGASVSFAKNSKSSPPLHLGITTSMSSISAWWLGHPWEKYEFVNWDDDIPNLWENKKWQPNHQPDKTSWDFRIMGR